jgi:hypothetical protein
MPDNQQVASDQTSIEQADAARRPAVIETASATTSPDNANSGAKPVVIAAVGVVVLLLLANALGGFVAGVTRFALMDELGRHADTLELGDPDGAYGDSDDSDDSDAWDTFDDQGGWWSQGGMADACGAPSRTDARA